MDNFTYWNPTKLIFGRGEVEKLAEEVKQYGRNVLLVYGGGSIKRNGLYDQVISILEKAGATVHELPGVEPNPRVATVNKGVAICKENDIDFLWQSAAEASLIVRKQLLPERNTTAMRGIL